MYWFDLSECAIVSEREIWAILGIAAQFARRSNNNSVEFYLLWHTHYVEEGLEAMAIGRDS